MNSILNKANPGGEDEIDLAALFHHLWQGKWLVLLFTSIGLLIGLLLASKQVPQYQTSALIQIDAKQAIGQAGNSVQQLMLGGSSGDSSDTQMSLIQSSFVLTPVIHQLGLDLSVFPKPAPLWKRYFISESKDKAHLSHVRIPRSFYNQQLIITLDSPEHVQVATRDHKQILSGKVGGLLATPDHRIQMKIDSMTGKVGSQFVVIKTSDSSVIKSLLSRLKLNESGSKTYRNTGVIDVTLNGVDPINIVHTLNAILNIAQVKDAQKKAQEASQTLDFLYKQLPLTKRLLEKAEERLNHYRARSGKIDIKLQSQVLLEQLAALDKEQSNLRVKTIEMQQQYTTSHPLFIALKAQVKVLEVQQHELLNELKKLPASDQVAVNLMRDVQVKESLYLMLLSKIQELEVVKAGTVSNVRILSYAKYPDSPLPGNRMFIYMGSMGLGVMFSMLIIFGRRYFSSRVDDPNWSERHFNLPNLAIVPFCKEQSENSLKYVHHETKQLALLAHSNPKNIAIESLRSLRTTLQVGLVGAKNNVISILGVSPGVGKSFISANLAYLLAAGGKRVLLMDVDMRRGTMHKYFGQAASPGLSEVLSHDVSLEQVLKPSFHPNLTLFPRGSYPKDPSELLIGDQFKTLMTLLSNQYDVVICDTAPILLVTDAVLVAGYSSINYLVLGADVHQPTEIEMVLRRLSNASVHVQGSIFNFHRLQKKHHYYGKYYYNYNSSYYEDKAITH